MRVFLLRYLKIKSYTIEGDYQILFSKLQKVYDMHYVMKNTQGDIIAVSAVAQTYGDWQMTEDNDPQLIQFIEKSLHQSAPFRESDIQLARVLEDLITLLTERNVIHFTDFPEAAQKRLIARQNMRTKNQLSGLLDDNERLF